MLGLVFSRFRVFVYANPIAVFTLKRDLSDTSLSKINMVGSVYVRVKLNIYMYSSGRWNKLMSKHNKCDSILTS